jgi:signal transduction histidine kinase
MILKFMNTLHFRIPMLFIGLLALVFFGYYQWVENTLYQVKWLDGEEEWYEDARKTETRELAQKLMPALTDFDSVQRLIDTYMETIEGYDFALTVFDTTGDITLTTVPESLSLTISRVRPVLLDSMSLDSWDFESYPNLDDLEAYENRINGVVAMYADGDSTGTADAWLVSSFAPVSVNMDDLEHAQHGRLLRGAASILVYSFISGLILMTWISRRIRALSADLTAFRGGDFKRRSKTKSSDELGILSQDFNLMADRITKMITDLKQSEEYRKQLVANISHDLRTPIASLRGYVETLEMRRHEIAQGDMENHLKAMTTNITNLDGLINRLFELTQLESEQYEYRMEDFPLEELASDMANSLENSARDQGIHLHLLSDEALPLVHADPVRIGQVLQNLLDNAVKFNKPGGRVQMTLSKASDRVRVEISDSGVGIAPDDLPHVFERFYTADKSRRHKGTGLGLAIANRIVSAHGSDLSVTSSQDKGTSFSFTLPIAPQSS